MKYGVFCCLLLVLSLGLAACGDPNPPGNIADVGGTDSGDVGDAGQDACVSNCEGKQGGESDGCGGTCSCVPESDKAFCERLRATCGTLKAPDNCEEEREASCGRCDERQRCDEVAHRCVCEPYTERELCAAALIECGALGEVDDGCGNTVEVFSCGTCPKHTFCGPDGACAPCVPESDLEFCARHGVECGTLSELDNCEYERTVTECRTGSACGEMMLCTPRGKCPAAYRPKNDACSDPVDANIGPEELVFDETTGYAYAYGVMDEALAYKMPTEPGDKDAESLGTLISCNEGIRRSSRDVVYTFSLTEPMTISVSLATAWAAAALELRSVCGVALDSAIACNLDMDHGSISLAPQNLGAGQYWLWVATPTNRLNEPNLALGLFTLSVQAVPIAEVAENDECGVAEPLALASGPTLFGADLRMATGQLVGGCAGTQVLHPELVYLLDLQQTHSLKATVRANAVDGNGVVPYLYLRSSCEEVASELFCNTNVDGRAELHVPRLGEGLWYLVVDAMTDAIGLVDLEVELAEPLPRPEGDLCSEALVPLTFEEGSRITVEGDLFAAGDDSETLCPGSGAGPEIVHAFELAEPAYVGVVLLGDDSTKGYLPAFHIRPDCTAIQGTLCGVTESYYRRAGLNAGLMQSPLGAGIHYLVVEGLNQNVGKYKLEITKYPVERHDQCSAAIPLTDFGDNDTLVAYGSLRENDARYRFSCATWDMAPGLAAVYEIKPPRDATLRGKITPSPGQALALIAEVRRECDEMNSAIRGTCKSPYSFISPAEFMVQRVNPLDKYYLWVRSRAYSLEGVGDVVTPGDFTIELELIDPVAPSNDLCVGASELVFDHGVALVTTTEEGEKLDTRFASDDYSGTCGTATMTQSGPDLVWYFDVTEPIAIDIKLTRADDSAMGHLAFSLRRSCAAPTPTDEVLCAYSKNGGGAEVSATHSYLAEEGRYYLVVDELGSASAPALGGLIAIEVTKRSPLPGDSCANKGDLGDITGLEKRISGDTRLAHRDALYDSSCVSSDAARDMVYAFTLTSAQTVELTVTPTNPTFNPVVSVHSACESHGARLPGGCARHETVPGVRQLFFGRLEGGTYYVWVTGYAKGSGVLADGAFELKVKASEPPTIPANSGCDHPQSLTLQDEVAGTGKYGSLSGDTTYSRNLDSGGGSCAGASGPELTYRFIVDSFPSSAEGMLIATVTPAPGSTLIPSVSVRSLANCGAPAAQKGCSASKLVNPTAASVKAGNGEYVVVVDGAEGSAGAFTLEVLVRPPLPGDTCDQVERLEFTAPVDGVAVATATIENLAQAGDDATTLSPSTICTMAGRDIVYLLDLSSGGRKVDVTVRAGAENAVYRPAFSLRKSCDDIFSEIGCKSLNTAGGSVSATFNWLSPGRYYLWVDAFSANASQGAVEVIVTTTALQGAPTNYSCQTALDISEAVRAHTPIEGNTAVAANNFRGTCEIAALTQNLSELVYKYTAQTAKGLEIVLTSNRSYAHVLVVRNVCESEAAVNELACIKTASTKHTSLENPYWAARYYVPRVDAEQTVYIIVDTTQMSNDAKVGPFKLEIEERPVAAHDTCEEAAPLIFEGNVATAQGNTSYASNTTHAYANGSMNGPMTLAGTYGVASSGFYGPELFYKFTIDQGKAFSVNVTVRPTDTGDGLKTVLYVRPSCASDFISANPSTVLPPIGYGLTQASSTTDSTAAFSLLVPRLDAGTYYVVVDSYGGETDFGPGAFELTVERTEILPGSVPANALCGESTAMLLDFTGATVEGSAQTKSWPQADTRLAGDSMQGSCGVLHGGDLFYKLDLSSERRVTATVTRDPLTSVQNSFTPAIYLRRNCEPGLENELACSMAREGTGDKTGIATLVHPKLGPGLWYLVVDGNQYSSGTFVLTVTLDEQAPQAPTNDSCFAPTPLLVNVESEQVTATTAVGGAPLANNDALASCNYEAASNAPGYTAQDLVYSIALDRPRRLTAQIVESIGIRPAIFLRKECAVGGFANELFCSRATAAGGVVAPVSAVLPEGLWYLWVDGYAATAGSFTLGVELSEIGSQLPPLNDNCQGTVPQLTAKVPVVGDTTNAVADYGWRKAMRCGFPVGVSARVPRGKDVVYSYTPTLDGDFALVLTPWTTASSDRPEIWVTKGLCGEESACVAIARSAPTGGKVARLPVWGEAGVTYYVIVGSSTAATPPWSGQFTLEVRPTAP